MSNYLAVRICDVINSDFSLKLISQENPVSLENISSCYGNKNSTTQQFLYCIYQVVGDVQEICFIPWVAFLYYEPHRSFENNNKSVLEWYNFLLAYFLYHEFSKNWKVYNPGYNNLTLFNSLAHVRIAPNLVHEFSDEFPNDLGPRTLRN